MFRELARKKKELSREACIDVLKSETRGVLSVIGDEGYPYGMPLNHYYNEEDGKLYFHTGEAGHRIDSLRKNNKVSFCTYDKSYLEDGQWAFQVKSVIVFGTVEILEDMEKIVAITTKLSHKFTKDDAYIQKEIELYGHETILLALTLEHICGKLVTEA